jgi:tetratricopeptide (TPR) repeat protein
MKSSLNRRPIWQPSRISRLKDLLVAALMAISLKRLVIFALTAPFLVYMYREVTRDVLVIEPFSVPKELEEAGLTPEVVAHRIGAGIRQIELEARTTMKRDNLVSMRDENPLVDVEIPGIKLGTRTLIETLRNVFGIYPRHISGDVTILPAPVSGLRKMILSTYLSQDGLKGAGTTFASGLDISGFDILIRETATEIVQQINPLVLASYLEDHGKDLDAAGIARKVLADSSQDDHHRAIAANLLGITFYSQQVYDKAISSYKRSIELDPNYAQPHNNLGAALANIGKADEAAIEYRKALRIDPRNPAPYNNLGLFFAAAQKTDEAVANYKKSVELDPKFSDAYQNWGFLLLSQGRYSEAEEKFVQAKDTDR